MYILPIFQFIITLLCFKSSESNYNDAINYNFTKVITSTEKGSLFGYSILLRKSHVYVGAPKASYKKYTTGGVLKCNLKTLYCSKLDDIVLKEFQADLNPNGAFLGSVLDGSNITDQPFYTCAPRATSIPDENLLMKGYCIKVENEIVTLKLKDIPNTLNINRNLRFGQFFYESGYAQIGLDLQYVPNRNSILTGAPGQSSGLGLIMAQSSNNVITYAGDDLRTLNLPINQHSNLYNYIGYAVAFGSFTSDPSRLWYVGGAPRANNLKGQVMFTDEMHLSLGNVKIKHEILSNEMGAHFGSTLLVLPHGKFDDLLVGAPMSRRDTSFDVGCVYYYKNRCNDQHGLFEKEVRICGSQAGGRFGLAMSFLGDINLDGYKDVAISAPFEDNGRGAVYIYFQIENKDLTAVHRISPENFQVFMPSTKIKGFGLGLSKSVDLYQNKHNAFAVGAFQTDQIFIFKPMVVIDHIGTILFDVKNLFRTSANFTVKYCIRSVWRNGMILQESVDVRLLVSDNRITNEKQIIRKLTIQHNMELCFVFNFQLAELRTFDPIPVLLEYKEQQETNYKQLITKELPINEQCLPNQNCIVDLHLRVISIIPKLVYGLNDSFKLEVAVTNSAKFKAYEVQLTVATQPKIYLNNPECTYGNNQYECEISRSLEYATEVKKVYNFDLSDIDITTTKLQLNLNVTNLEEEHNLSNNKLNLQIPIEAIISPYFTKSDSLPNILIDDTNNNETEFSLQHDFMVGNDGPSSLLLDLVFLLPNVAENNRFVFQEISNKEGVNCVSEQVSTNFLITKNITNQISCRNSKINCLQYHCKGSYVAKSTNIQFSLKFKTNLHDLGESLKDANVTFETIAILNGVTLQIESFSTTVFTTVASKSVPAWIYVIGSIIGLILITVLTAILYKCNFFRRQYQEMINGETSDSNEEIVNIDNMELNPTTQSSSINYF